VPRRRARPIHFREDDPINTQPFVEALGNIDRILPGHGIGHQEHLAGLSFPLISRSSSIKASSM